MHKKCSKIFCLIAFAACSSLLGNEGLGLEGEEVMAVYHLIEATAKQLDAQNQLKNLIVSFHSKKREFIAGEDEKRVGYELVKVAKATLLLIQKEHLQEVFSREYLEELEFFTKLSKNGIKH